MPDDNTFKSSRREGSIQQGDGAVEPHGRNSYDGGSPDIAGKGIPDVPDLPRLQSRPAERQIEQLPTRLVGSGIFARKDARRMQPVLAHGRFNLGGVDIGHNINRIRRLFKKGGRFIEKGRAPPIGVEELAEYMRILRRAELRQCAAKGGKFQPPLCLKSLTMGNG